MAGLPIDLSKEWAELCREFIEGTGCDVNDNDCDIQSIMHRLEAMKAKDDETKATLRKAQKVVRNTLEVLQRIGSIAATGGSMAFGSPANITMNCISSLIKVGYDFKGIADNIATIFEKVAFVMQRLQLCIDNQEILNSSMVRVTHDMLIAIVRICKLCTKRLKEHRTMHGGFKQLTRLTLWGSDGDVKRQLDLLADLEARELQMKSSVTMHAVEITKRKVETVEGTVAHTDSSVNELKQQSTDAKIMTEIKEHLGADDASSRDEYQAWVKDLSSESCKWLQDDPDYQTWSSGTGGGPPLLVLSGDEGCGKSYTLSAIIKDLRTRYTQDRQDAGRTSVAYSYLTRTSDKEAKTKASQSAPSISDAVRTWAVQVASNDSLYRKDVYGLIKSKPDNNDLTDMWRDMFSKQIEKGATMFLVLDGLHELEESGLTELASISNLLSSNQSALRVAFACRPAVLGKLRSMVNQSVSVMNLPDKTKPDIERCIRSQADKLDIFQKQRTEVQELKEEVCTGLSEAVNGNFKLADLKLVEIGKKYDPKEVRAIVEQTKRGANLTDTIRDDIRKCNATLSAREMEDLNIILLWVMYAEWPLGMNELEAVLSLHGRPALQPLRTEIEGKFSAFLAVDQDSEPQVAEVTLKLDAIGDYFKDTWAQRDLSTMSSPKDMSKNEIRIVQHFVERLCEQDMYERLGLPEFFEQKLNKTDIGVTVDCDNAHANIMCSCLRLFSEKTSKDTEDLLMYACVHVFAHLKQIDLDKVDPAVKSEIGPLLLKLLRDPDSIKRYVEDCWAAPLSYNDEGLEQIVRLLQSSAVRSKIAKTSPENAAWVTSVSKSKYQQLDLLEGMAKVVSMLWLTVEEEWSCSRHFYWLNGYLNKLSSKDDVRGRQTEVPDESDVTAQDIGDVLSQARELCSDNPPDEKALRNVGMTYIYFGFTTKAVESLKHALDEDPERVHVRRALAQAYARKSQRPEEPKPDWAAALYHQDIVIKRVQDGTRLLEDVEANDTLNRDLLPDKGTWLRKAGRFAEARTLFEDVLNADPEDEAARAQLITTLNEMRCFSDIVQLVRTLCEETDDGSKTWNLYTFFRQNAHDARCHNSIVKAFKEVGSLPEMRAHYQNAVDSAAQDLHKPDTDGFDARRAYCYTTFFLGVMLRRYGEASEGNDAIKLWEVLVDSGRKSDLTYTWVISMAAERLARAYFAQAAELGPSTEAAQAMLVKVQKLSIAGDDGDDDPRQIGLKQAHLRSLMGRYFYRTDAPDKARETLKRDVELGIKLLSDDDDSNDYQGYEKLAGVFTDIGDEDNARAAWSLIQPDPEPVVEQTTNADNVHEDGGQVSADKLDLIGADTSEASVNESAPPPPLRRATTASAGCKPRQGPYDCYCDGRVCLKTWTYADNFFVCKECVNIVLCTHCKQKLHDGELESDICDPDHAFLHVPAWDPASEARFRNKIVVVGEKEMSIDAWKEGIKQQWGLMDGTQVVKVDQTSEVTVAA